MTRVPFQADMRAAAVDLLRAYATDAVVGLQVHRARPTRITPPTAFVDSVREVLGDYNAWSRERRVQVDVIVLHGVFDSGETVDQRDRFVDGFLDWTVERFHAAGANTNLEVRAVRDLPVYVPDWLPSDVNYYATVITLEGAART
jgi:hypothetical protein